MSPGSAELELLPGKEAVLDEYGLLELSRPRGPCRNKNEMIRITAEEDPSLVLMMRLLQLISSAGRDAA